MDMSQSDSVLVTGHKTGDLKIWSSTQMKLMQTVESVHAGKVECCRFSNDGKHIYSLGRDHLIKVTDFATLKEIATIE